MGNVKFKDKKDKKIDHRDKNSSEHNGGKGSSKEIEDLKLIISEKDEQILRLHADFDNFRKRTEQRFDEFQKSANKGLIVELLGIVDDYERALASAENAESVDHLREGFSQIYKKLMHVLKSCGLTCVDCVGENFDPNLHEAVFMFESDEHEDNMVTDEIQKGYAIHDVIIRHPKVRVAKNSSSKDDKKDEDKKKTEGHEEKNN
ncbi:MAG: nucleotide exchange factor GrpE [Candidatus Aenigmarchaeota archaeon]|nr:nucleotide exchange factor GrpE [Candidatus Aenigmarchaeota archaeon]